MVKQEKRTIAAKVPASVAAELEALAKRQGTTMTAQVNIALSEYLERRKVVLDGG